MEEAVISMAKLSPIVAGLLIIVWYLAKKVDRNDDKQELRSEAASKACQEREATMRAEAARREQHLADRLTVVEDRNNTQLTTLLSASIEAQRANAEATRAMADAVKDVARVAEASSGVHRAVRSREPDKS